MKNKLLSLAPIDILHQDLINLGSANKVAQKYKINIYTVYNTFKMYGINPYVKPSNVEDWLTPSILNEMYQELQSFRKVGKVLGLSNETIRKYIHKWNIDYNTYKYTANYDLFSEENELSYYIAGFYAADGCVKTYHETPVLSLTIAATDLSHLEKIKSAYQTDKPIYAWSVTEEVNGKLRTCHKVDLSFSSKKLCDDAFKYFGISPRKSQTYEFPQNIIDSVNLHHFMRGYFDGDGSFYLNRKNENYTYQVFSSLAGSEDFLNTFRAILSPILRKNGCIEKKKGIYSLSYGGNGVSSAIAKFLYKDATIYLERKYDIIKHFLV